MHSTFDSPLPEGRDGLGFLSRLGIAFALVSAGVGVAMWIATAAG